MKWTKIGFTRAEIDTTIDGTLIRLEATMKNNPAGRLADVLAMDRGGEHFLSTLPEAEEILIAMNRGLGGGYIGEVIGKNTSVAINANDEFEMISQLQNALAAIEGQA